MAPTYSLKSSSKPRHSSVQKFLKSSPPRRRNFTRPPRPSRYDHLFSDSESDDDDKNDDDRNPLSEARPEFHWEDEKTLIDELNDTDDDLDQEEEISNLLNSLQDSFKVAARHLDRDIASTLVPASNHVKKVHRMLKDEVDLPLGAGVLEFNDAAKLIESHYHFDQQEVSIAYKKSQERIQDLFGQLKAAFEERDQLWVDFEADTNQTLDPVLNSLKAFPAKMEQSLAQQDKLSKKATKMDNKIFNTLLRKHS